MSTEPRAEKGQVPTACVLIRVTTAIVGLSCLGLWCLILCILAADEKCLLVSVFLTSFANNC